jgi:hypothetical protein
MCWRSRPISATPVKATMSWFGQTNVIVRVSPQTSCPTVMRRSAVMLTKSVFA